MRTSRIQGVENSITNNWMMNDGMVAITGFDFQTQINIIITFNHNHMIYESMN